MHYSDIILPFNSDNLVGLNIIVQDLQIKLTQYKGRQSPGNWVQT